ncbi:hypothetical protein [Paraburkholderia humisilvae]|uniref:Transmembrane protein n=1 Tax=Paraburkholderia humisilvae TaxID=627669 RepID=A0A6J5CX62_9BURK|nr:hypothetical protein [Paraburkholderia humisilvae]CAB3745757.1 hypothetical protein LMG29542_00036 [Paraburkholderia humisilvae]
MILYLCVINIAGGVFIWKVVGCAAAQRDYAVILGAFVTVLIGAPLIAFLCLGWYTRYREFENSLKGSALSAYLQRYWSKRLIDALIDKGVLDTPPDNDSWRDLADKMPDLCDRLFASIYHEQYGLTPFVPPFLILLCIAYAAASVIACNYTPSACEVATASTCVYGISQEVLLGSFGGALMFVVSDAVLSIRRKALNVSDVYWYALRIMLAVPLALVVGGTDGSHTAIAFALGTFPVDALMKIIRRFGFPQLTQFEKDENSPDKLLSLNGVTLPIVSVFEAEGVNSVEQVAAADPVLLSIRTGFPFRYTLRLCSQAIVRRHFGEDAAKLIPIGLADVVPVYLLVKAMDGITLQSLPVVDDKDNVIKNAATRLFPNDDDSQRIPVTKMKFRQIAAEEFTVMLARITPLDPAL